MSTHLLRRIATGAVVAALVAPLASCAVTVPSDPDGTLDAVRGGQLRVGVSEEPGLITLVGDDASGPLADVVEGFAEELDATVMWIEGGEELLVTRLEAGTIDLAVGGFTDATPWVERAGVTRGYPDLPGSEGRSLVMLVPAGENAFLAELEAHLDEESGS